MKNIWTLGLILICLASCESKPEEYYIKRIEFGRMLIDTSKVFIEKEIKANKISLTYRTVFDTISYVFDLKNIRKSKIIAPYYGAPTFNLVKEYLIKTENKNYRIYHFSTFHGAIDSGSEHYWNEELGVFFTRGRSWPNYFILQSTDENKNKIVWRIIKDVYPEIKKPLEYMNFLKKDKLIKER